MYLMGGPLFYDARERILQISDPSLPRRQTGMSENRSSHKLHMRVTKLFPPKLEKAANKSFLVRQLKKGIER